MRTRQQWSIAVVGLMLIGAAGGYLMQVRAHQKMGLPGVKTAPLEGGKFQVLLPPSIPGYVSEDVPIAEVVTNTLPLDTSYGQRLYKAEDGFEVASTVVLMGKDRTSIHKPQICLISQGWVIDKSEVVSIPVQRPVAYELPVSKLTVSPARSGSLGGLHGVYVYWLVAEDRYTPRHERFMWLMAKHLLQTHELQRWAYVTFFSICAPGQEEATFERMKHLIAASVPEFQLVPRPQTPSPTNIVASHVAR